jgi:hypothetical protein
MAEPHGPWWQQPDRPGELTEEGFIRMAESAAEPRARGVFVGAPSPADATPVVAAPGRCGYCGGVIGSDTEAGLRMVRAMQAGRCPCGRRAITATVHSGVLVHGEGCAGGLDCACWHG